jgi:hypothetical protein
MEGYGIFGGRKGVGIDEPGMIEMGIGHANWFIGAGT